MVMDSIVSSQGHKQFPAQGHLNPMLQLANLLHSHGFHITFVNTEHNHNRLIQASGPTTVAGSTTFRFETIPDGLPPTDNDSTQDVVLLTASVEQHCLIPFKELIARLNKAGDVPPFNYIVSDAVMLFTLEAAQEIGIPEVLLWTFSACGLLGYIQSQNLLEHGIIPFKGTCNCGILLFATCQTFILWYITKVAPITTTSNSDPKEKNAREAETSKYI